MSNETWKIKSWDPWLDLNTEDCTDLPDCCGLDAFRRFTGLTNINPNFHPMISVGKKRGIVFVAGLSISLTGSYKPMEGYLALIYDRLIIN